MTPAPKVEPCPFCGGEGDVCNGQPGDFFVCCRVCGADSGICETPEEAIAAWNRRAPSTAGRREVAGSAESARALAGKIVEMVLTADDMGRPYRARLCVHTAQLYDRVAALLPSPSAGPDARALAAAIRSKAHRESEPDDIGQAWAECADLLGEIEEMCAALLSAPSAPPATKEPA